MHFPLRLALIGLALAAVAGCGSDTADDAVPTTTADLTSDYAGQEARTIKTLSDTDIDDLRNGRGWGLAKAAELNGVPGPAHILEMKVEIDLSADQESQIVAIYDEMQAAAIILGERLIEQEVALNRAFRADEVVEQSLTEMVEAISATTAELRILHLATHLETPDILTAEQIDEYNELRGYLSDDDPCENVPEGHDETMWRKHNDCD